MNDASVFVNDLYIVAGSRSSGKSTLIDWCQNLGHSPECPTELLPISTFSEPVYFMELRKLTDTYHQRMLVHVDIFTPFADLIAPTKADLMSGLSVNKFASYPNSTYLSRANKITIFTLRTPRRTILQRLLEKCASKKSELVRTLLAQIYSDVYGEAPYQRLCQAWDDFTSILPNATRWNVIEKDTGYLVLPQDGQES